MKLHSVYRRAPVEDKIPIPGLYRSKTAELVVLMTRPVGGQCGGVVVREVMSDYSLGEYREDWNLDQFRPLDHDEEVVLRNGRD